MGIALLLEGCESFPWHGLQEFGGARTQPGSLLTPKQFEAKVGSVEEARAQIARGIDSPSAFVQRFLTNSPRIQTASKSGGTVGSVLYNPRPAAIASAVKFQLARGKGEPELLHNDLGEMAAAQYARYGQRTFAAVFPSTVSIIGDGIHKDRALLQLVVNGNLPSEKIVCTNEDLESLIGRQLTFASQMVHGLRFGHGIAPISGTAIWTDEREQQKTPEGAIRLSLVSDLIRLEVAGKEVKAITPPDPREHPTGWQKVSEAYRNFAVGQLIEAERAVARDRPHNALEKTIVDFALGEYQPYLADVKKRLDWGHKCNEVYRDQKQDGRADLLTQPVLVHSEGARKKL